MVLQAALESSTSSPRSNGGWVEAAETKSPQPLEDSQITEEGVSLSELKAAMQPDVSIKCPANLQEETDLQALGWHKEWGSELTEVEEPQVADGRRPAARADPGRRHP